MEAINAFAIDRFQQDDIKWLHFGLTPFTGLDPEHEVAGASRLVTGVINLIERRGERIYPARTQLSYKQKRGPHLVLPEYLAFEGRPRLGVRISGVKRPCSLAHSMDLLTASVLIPGQDGARGQLAVALIPAGTSGMSVKSFWSTWALAGAESDEVVLDDVLVPAELLVPVELEPGEHLDALQVVGFLWFELLMSGSYLGIASGLVERVLADERISPIETVRLVADLEAAMYALENLAGQVDTGASDPELLGQALLVRYAAQDAIHRVAPRAVELLGGMRFIGSNDLAYLSASVNALPFHPPSRAKMAGSLAAFARGSALVIT
jgi:alkylation response protein AidB-like acyl-CoA dehydrogenase